jgi:hypothetical protein
MHNRRCPAASRGGLYEKNTAKTAHRETRANIARNGGRYDGKGQFKSGAAQIRCGSSGFSTFPNFPHEEMARVPLTDFCGGVTNVSVRGVQAIPASAGATSQT